MDEVNPIYAIFGVLFVMIIFIVAMFLVNNDYVVADMFDEWVVSSEYITPKDNSLSLNASGFSLNGTTVYDWSEVNVSSELVNTSGLVPYTGGSAYVCVYDSGVLFASETACP